MKKIGNVNVYRIYGGKFLFPFWAFLKSIKLNRKQRYSVVWSIMANRAGFAALFFKLWRPGVKYLLTLPGRRRFGLPGKRMGFLKIFLKPVFRKIFTKADHIQTISNYLADWARDMGAKVPIEVAPNGVDLNKIKSKILKTKNSGKIIITTSRLVHKNGVDVLIRAVAELKNMVSEVNFKVQIIGSGSDEKTKRFSEGIKS